MFKNMNKNVDIRNNKVLFKVVFIIIVIIFTTQILYMNRYINIKYEKISELDNRFGSNGSMDFSDFDNELGTRDGRYIVPNIIHFIRFSNDTVTYSHMICYLAAYKNQKPDKIYFHYNDQLTFSGKYWNILQETPGFMDIVEFYYMEMPTEIFGQQLSDIWRVYHASDVARIRVLMKYGGIFLDNDSYVVRSLNDFRRYEMTLNWDDLPEVLGTQVLLAHKDARFLRMWLESYRGAYNSTLWYYNAAKRPTHEVLLKRPELIHRVKFIFGVNIRFAEYLYVQYWSQWKVMYTFHLPYIRFYSYMFANITNTHYPTLPKSFDEFNIKNFNNTFREMALEVHDPLLFI